MEELKNYIETMIALTVKHIADDEARLNDPILRDFNRGRLAIEKNTLDAFKKISDMVNRL